MCGIVGILGSSENAEKFLMQGIQLLQNRGYDSAGIVTFTGDQKATLTKYATDMYNKEDCIQTLQDNIHQHENAISGLGHTRWATCGPKTQENAHPHFDMDNNIYLIHNGTLENPELLRQDLTDLGVKLTSETDSELIAQYIGYFMKQNMTLMDAAKKTFQEKIRGTWGLAAIDRNNPSQMLVCRNGSPLQIGLGNEAIYVASEKIAFQQFTNNFISLQDGEIVLLDINNKQEFYKNIQSRIGQIRERDNIQLRPSWQYNSFYEQEIEEQPEALLRTMGNGSRLSFNDDCTKLGGLELNTPQISVIENLVIFGCGTSLYAGQYAAVFYKKLAIFNTVTCIEASDFEEHDLPADKAGAIFISQSGETKDIYHAVSICKRRGLFCIGVINTVGSLVASSVDCGIYINTQREVAVPASKSFSSQVTALLMMGVWISYHKEHAHMKPLRMALKDNIRQLPINFGLNLQLITNECKQLAHLVSKEKFLMILGKGDGLAIAKEGALKIKEITYIHAEAFSAGEMKHGPIALIQPERHQTKIILVIMDDENLQTMLLALDEVKARLAYAIVITNCPQKVHKADTVINVIGQNWSLLSSFIAVTVFQKLSNEIAKVLGLNPDKPRNLAKTVTV